MDDIEKARLQKIDAELAELERRLAQVQRVWNLLTAEKKALHGEIRGLYSEREALTQGQLVFQV